jgi:hypothetical protein
MTNDSGGGSVQMGCSMLKKLRRRMRRRSVDRFNAAVFCQMLNAQAAVPKDEQKKCRPVHRGSWQKVVCLGVRIEDFSGGGSSVTRLYDPLPGQESPHPSDTQAHTVTIHDSSLRAVYQYGHQYIQSSRG